MIPMGIHLKMKVIVVFFKYKIYIDVLYILIIGSYMDSFLIVQFVRRIEKNICNEILFIYYEVKDIVI